MKFIFSLLVAVIVGSLSCSAADFDSVDYYSLSSVQSLSPVSNSALDYGVSLASATSWDTSDQLNLAYIRNAFYDPNSGYVSNSIIGWVKKLADNSIDLTNLASDVSSIDGNFYLNVPANEGSLIDTVRDLEDLLDTLNRVTVPAGNLSLDEIESDTGSLKDTALSILYENQDILSEFRYLNENATYINRLQDIYSILDWQQSFGGFYSLWADDVTRYGNDSLWRLVHKLQEVLASDDDVALAESQKANREEIEDSFLTGSSGSTSLGVSDFGDLADVGGTIKDSLSLDGNATIGSFTSGLAAADSAGQGWFSEETRSQLDAVSSTVTYSLRDPDPYNMAGWENRYYWLLGDGD